MLFTILFGIFCILVFAYILVGAATTLFYKREIKERWKVDAGWNKVATLNEMYLSCVLMWYMVDWTHLKKMKEDRLKPPSAFKQWVESTRYQLTMGANQLEVRFGNDEVGARICARRAQNEGLKVVVEKVDPAYGWVVREAADPGPKAS